MVSRPMVSRSSVNVAVGRSSSALQQAPQQNTLAPSSRKTGERPHHPRLGSCSSRKRLNSRKADPTSAVAAASAVASAAASLVASAGPAAAASASLALSAASWSRFSTARNSATDVSCSRKPSTPASMVGISGIGKPRSLPMPPRVLTTTAACSTARASGRTRAANSSLPGVETLIEHGHLPVSPVCGI
ncbi:hypothetical protein M885DRAFT_509884 [Pelagophyceae sp. CCMP2097]|nr:hypothetical protein M885DRAFT_509884 [Pelagophyceae sp. CCMP2097]